MVEVKAVKCDKCGKLHEIISNTYITVYGNICFGDGGGLVGNNIDDEDRVINTNSYCYPHCISEILQLKNSTTR